MTNRVRSNENKGEWEIGRDEWRINVHSRNHANRPLDIFVNGIPQCVGNINQRGEKQDIRKSSRPMIFEPTNEIAELVGEIIKGDRSNATFDELENVVSGMLIEREGVNVQHNSCIEVLKRLGIRGLTVNEIDVDGETVIIVGQNVRDAKGKRFGIHIQSSDIDELQTFLAEVFEDSEPFLDATGMVRI